MLCAAPQLAGVGVSVPVLPSASDRLQLPMLSPSLSVKSRVLQCHFVEKELDFQLSLHGNELLQYQAEHVHIITGAWKIIEVCSLVRKMNHKKWAFQQLRLQMTARWGVQVPVKQKEEVATWNRL